MAPSENHLLVASPGSGILPTSLQRSVAAPVYSRDMEDRRTAQWLKHRSCYCEKPGSKPGKTAVTVLAAVKGIESTGRIKA